MILFSYLNQEVDMQTNHHINEMRPGTAFQGELNKNKDNLNINQISSDIASYDRENFYSKLSNKVLDKDLTTPLSNQTQKQEFPSNSQVKQFLKEENTNSSQTHQIEKKLLGLQMQRDTVK